MSTLNRSPCPAQFALSGTLTRSWRILCRSSFLVAIQRPEERPLDTQTLLNPPVTIASLLSKILEMVDEPCGSCSSPENHRNTFPVRVVGAAQHADPAATSIVASISKPRCVYGPRNRAIAPRILRFVSWYGTLRSRHAQQEVTAVPGLVCKIRM
jgi:hypothetical protein